MTRTTACAALDEYVADLMALQFSQRGALPRAENGRTIAPSDSYAAQVMKDMTGGRSAELRRLVAVWVCNLRDGVNLPTVKLILRRIESILDVEAGTYRPRSMIALHRRETREQGVLDLAQFRTTQDESDLEALRAQSQQLAAYQTILEELQYETDRRIAIALSGRSTELVTIDPAEHVLPMGAPTFAETRAISHRSTKPVLVLR
jgi:hypothetical protein